MSIRHFNVTLVIFCVLVAVCGGQDLGGRWDAKIDCPGGPIRFGLDLIKGQNGWSGFLVNGPERINIPVVEVVGKTVTLRIDHYDSTIELDFESGDHADGSWKKRLAFDKWLNMKCSVVRHQETEPEGLVDTFLGRWAVKFSSSDDPAVGIFKRVAGKNRVLGTFMTTTGDYRFLDGFVKNGVLQLSCFDGAHAFLFKAKFDEPHQLTGDFWSSSSWHETWTAILDENAALPDDFLQTKINENVDLGGLSFPDLEGNVTRLDDSRFSGKARIIYVFGTWCPNCHDAGEYFAELEKKYGSQGLSILGLAFEHTGEFKRDAEQVRKYLKRHGSSYPVLVAGLSGKANATKAFPVLDRVRSYPTTIFLDGKGNVTDVHSGFTGPATGKAFEDLKQKFEKIIVENLNH